MGTIREASPHLKARLAGVFELLEGMTSAYGQVFVMGRLVVAGNAAATAASILGHPVLFWSGFALSLVAVPLHLAWASLFRDLLKPVNKSVASLAMNVVVVACAIQALTCLLYLSPLVVLQIGDRGGFTAEQLQSLAVFFFRLNAGAFNIYLVFFGLWCTLTGYLILRSSFLPRILGALLAVDGAGWTTFLVPPWGSHLFPAIAAVSAIAEYSLIFWLLARGVNTELWRKQADAADLC